MFLMVKGAKHGVIKGEAQDDEHKGEIDVVELVVGHAGQGHRSAAAPPPARPRINELQDRQAGRQRVDGADGGAADQRADPEGRADAAEGRQDASSST